MSTGLALASAVRETNPPAPPPPPPGNGIVQGTRSKVGGGVLGGGTVKLYRTGSVFVADAVPDGAGFYQVAGLADDTYYAVDHPPPGFAIASTQAGALSYTPTANPSGVIVGGVGVTINLLVEPTAFTDLFQGYANDANLNATGLVIPGPSAVGANTDQAGGWNVPGGAAIVLDAAGGPAGGKAMRYNWPARPASGCNNDITLRAIMRFNPQRGGTDWYVRFRDKWTNPWQNGSQASCPAGQWEIKHILCPIAGGSFNLLMPHGHPAPPNNSLNLNLTMSGAGPGQSTSNALQGNELNIGLPNGAFFGVYALWVMEIHGVGSASPSITLWREGVQILALTKPASVPNFTWNPGNNLTFLELGANLDSGPDAIQNRWFSELSISNTRPSNLP